VLKFSDILQELKLAGLIDAETYAMVADYLNAG
jgi:hypothetical protein